MKKLKSFFEAVWKVIITVLPVFFDLSVLEFSKRGAMHAAGLGRYELAVIMVAIIAVYLAVRLMGYPYRAIYTKK